MRRTALLACLALVCTLAAAARASEGPPPKLQPKTYLSPSGEYALFVNPSDQHGVGPATYTLKRREQVLWKKDLPYSLWEAAVTDDGRSCGYAYSHGFQGWGASAGYGNLVVALIGVDGAEIGREITARTDGGGGMICPPNRQPSPRGFYADPGLGRFVVRLPASAGDIMARGESWWLYSLTDGKRTGTLDLPYPGPTGQDTKIWYFAADADAVPGTGLTLVAWSRTNWRPNGGSDEGCRLALIDQNAKEVWSKEWPEEFRGVQYFSPWDMTESDVTPAARFSPGRFVYRSYSQQAAVTFGVTKAEDGAWKVEQVGSTPEAVRIGRLGQQAPALEQAPAVAGVRTLERIASVSLSGTGAAASLDIGDFEFDGRGRCGYLAARAEGALEIARLDPADADPVKSAVHMALQLPKIEYPSPQIAWIGGDRWVVVRGAAKAGPTQAWIADLGVQTLSPIDGFKGPKPRIGRAVVGGGERGFAIRGDSGSNELVRYDAAGKCLWSAKIWAEDVTILPDGGVAALVNIQNLIVVYDAQGRHTKTIKLAEGFAAKPEYLAGLEADAGGGWIVHDFAGHPPVVRLSADNKQTAAFTPHYPDGRTFRLYGGVRRAPDGTLWTSDRAALLRLAPEGTVDRAIGAAPDADTIEEIRAVTVDGVGRLYALDGHTGVTHVFDKEGKRLRVLRPSPTDFPTDCGIGSITVAADGEAYVRPSSIGMGETRYLKFDSGGKRAGFEPRRSSEVCDEWFFRPGGRECVVLGYERAFLYDAKGERVRTLERRADGLWLVHPEDAAVAPDGSFAILASAGLGGREPGPSVTLFTAAGDAVATHALPHGRSLARVAACNRSVAVIDNGDLMVIDRASGKTATYSIPGAAEKKSWFVPFFSPDGAEVWIVDAAHRQLERYKTPPIEP